MSGLGIKELWRLFFILTTALVMWFFVQFMMQMVPYMRLNCSTLAEIKKFSVKELKEKKFGVEACFSYKVNGKVYEQSKVLSAPIFLNQYGAESHIQAHWKGKGWTVWYSKKDPAVASLQKLFPFKKLFSCALSLGVLFYFFWLRSYTNRLNA